MARLVINFACNWHAPVFIYKYIWLGLMNWQLELEITGDFFFHAYGKGNGLRVLEVIDTKQNLNTIYGFWLHWHESPPDIWSARKEVIFMIIWLEVHAVQTGGSHMAHTTNTKHTLCRFGILKRTKTYRKFLLFEAPRHTNINT